MNNGTKVVIRLRLFEKIILASFVAIIAVSVFMNLTIKSKVYQLNIEIQNLEASIEQQTNLNLAYTSEIREATSFENLSRLANEFGYVTGNSSTFVLEDQ
jgi:cell division protein FtsL